MTTATQKNEAIESVLIQGDLKALNPDQRVQYYQRVCDSLGLNPLTRPFEYLTFQGKLVLYARRDATEQLRKRDGISITIVGRKLEGGVYTVSARARTADGREDESDGVVYVDNLKGDGLANAYMKAETKAKRRVTLSICGLGMLDESEIPEQVVTATQPELTPKQLPQNGQHRSPPNLHPAVTSGEAWAELLTRKGKSWTAALDWLNSQLAPSQQYPHDADWLDNISLEHRELVVQAVIKMPDAKKE